MAVAETVHALQPDKGLTPVERLAKLDNDIEAAKIVLKALEAQREALEEQALNHMIDEGSSLIRADQFQRTVHFAHDVFAAKGPEISVEQFLDVLHKHDMYDFDTYSAPVFRAWVKEQLGVDKGKLPDLGFNEDGTPVTPEQYIERTLPKWLVEMTSIRTAPRVRTRKVAKK